MKFQCLQKKVLKLKQYFQKNKAVTGKTPFFVIGLIGTPLFIYLSIGFSKGHSVWESCA